MILRCGSTDIPESLQGWRKITGCNSVAIFILRNDGKKSDLPLKKASLVEYDGQTLTTYAAGLRDLTEEEQRVMDGWKKISSTEEFKERAINDAYTVRQRIIERSGTLKTQDSVILWVSTRNAVCGAILRLVR